MRDDNGQQLPSESPYKSLIYFDTSDAASFFGRDEEISAVSLMVLEQRLSLLYGASGTGKTSLLLAGVLPFLDRPESRCLPIYARLLGEQDEISTFARLLERPNAVLRQEIQRAVLGHLPILGSAGLVGKSITGYLRDLIIDQFKLADIRLLCSDLNIKYEDLPGETISVKAEELIDFCNHHKRLPDLLRRCRNLRPPSQQWLDDLPSERLPLLVKYDQVRNGSPFLFLQVTAELLDVTLVLMIDQFEEFFRRSEKDREQFIDLLAKLHDAQSMPVHVLLSLREDWLASIDEIEERVPALANRKRRKRLLPLSRPNAREAVLRPLQDGPYRFQDGLIEILLDDLIKAKETSIMPVQLQIVCSALFERMAADGHREMRLDDYHELGGAEYILSQHFARVLAAFPSEQGAIANQVLEELINSKGNRVVKSLDEIAAALARDPGFLKPVLEQLLTKRMVHDVGGEEGGVTRYELAHDYLVNNFQQDQATRERKRVEEMVRRELEDWGDKKTLISAQKMRLINSQRDLLFFPPAADELLFRSALESGEDPTYWLGRLKDENTRKTILLEAATSDDDAAKRQRAAIGLIQVVPEAEDAAPLFAALVKIALTDNEKDNRDKATSGLQKLAGGGHYMSVKDALEDAAPSVDASIKARITYVDFLGKLYMPLGLWPVTIRRPLLFPWLLNWTRWSFYSAILGIIGIVPFMLAVRWVLTNLFKAPELVQTQTFEYITIGVMSLFIGAMISGGQLQNLVNLLPPPFHKWQEFSAIAWLFGALLAAVFIEGASWPALLADRGLDYMATITVPFAVLAISLLLVVVTAQWLVLRRHRFRFPLLPLWGWSLALMVPLIAALGVATMAANIVLLAILAVLTSFLYGLLLPSLAVGVWLVFRARKEEHLRPAPGDAS